MMFPEKVYIVIENGLDWSIIRGVFKHRSEAVKFQKKIIEADDSMVRHNLDLSSMDIQEEPVL